MIYLHVIDLVAGRRATLHGRWPRIRLTSPLRPDAKGDTVMMLMLMLMLVRMMMVIMMTIIILMQITVPAYVLKRAEF